MLTNQSTTEHRYVILLFRFSVMSRSKNKSVNHDLCKDENMEVKKDETLYPAWSFLPPIVLENIYSFLTRRDQCSMSLTCKSWYQAYSSPEVWRKMKFCLPDQAYQSLDSPKMRHAMKYSKYFHHIEIICDKVERYYFAEIKNQLKMILRHMLCDSKLRSIRFENMEMYVKCVKHNTESLIWHEICLFLKNQNILKLFEFRNAQFNSSYASVLLGQIFSLFHNGNLKQMLLDGFVDQTTYSSFPGICIDNQLLSEILMNLKVFAFDYSHLFEDIIEMFYKYACLRNLQGRKGRLQILKLFCFGSDPVKYAGISPKTWHFLKGVLPDLKVELTFLGGSAICNSENVFIVDQMPVKTLHFVMEYFDGIPSRTGIGSLLQHLKSCEVNEHIEELLIVWLRYSPNLARDLINFVGICPRMKILHLEIQHPVESLDAIFNSWLVNRPLSLKHVHISVQNARTRKAIAAYINIKENFAPLLYSLGINLVIDQ